MRKTDAPGSVSNEFVDYDEATSTPGTVVEADWLNDVQDELIGVQARGGYSDAPGSSEQVAEVIVSAGYFGFGKEDSEGVAWSKTGTFSLETSQEIAVYVNKKIFTIASGTSITMPITPVVGNDYAIWINPDGTLEATESFSTGPEVNSRRVGGFHYAPGGNATLDANGNWANHTGGDTTAQINEYSLWDLKFRPAVDDPRGLTLVPGLNEWWGIYPASNGNEGGPLHMYNVEPTRDGNAPYKMWADTPTQYNDATPMNIFELLAYHGFRPPQPWNFQFAALGTTEETSAGGTDPGMTGDMSDTRNKERFTSAWGLFDITGVIRAWSSDSWLDTSDTVGVTQGRSDEIFRIQRFAPLGGSWGSGSTSGSRSVNTFTSSDSRTGFGGRGVCDHLILP